MRFGELKVWTEEAESGPVICAEGEVDLGTVDALRRAASEAVKAKPEVITFDLRRVTYLDSTGLGVLVAARRQLGNRTGSVVVITAQPAVLQSLMLTGLDRVLQVVPEPKLIASQPSN